MVYQKKGVSLLMRKRNKHMLRCFLFQAEDGIRGLVRSRGHGEVYKRQGMAHGYFPLTKAVILDPCILTADAFSTQREKEKVFCCKCIGRLWLDSMGWVGFANSHLDPPPRSDA